MIGLEFIRSAALNGIAPVSDSDAPVLRDVREVLERRDRLRRFGVGLLHDGIGLKQSEVLLETCDLSTRALHCVAAGREDKRVSRGVETTWSWSAPAEAEATDSLAIRTCQRQCTVVRVCFKAEDGSHQSRKKGMTRAVTTSDPINSYYREGCRLGVCFVDCGYSKRRSGERVWNAALVIGADIVEQPVNFRVVPFDRRRNTRKGGSGRVRIGSKGMGSPRVDRLSSDKRETRGIEWGASGGRFKIMNRPPSRFSRMKERVFAAGFSVRWIGQAEYRPIANRRSNCWDSTAGRQGASWKSPQVAV